MFRGAGLIFFAYIGFDAVSTAAQEAKNPQRDMPIGILGSLVICTILYILVSLTLTGMVPYDRAQRAAPGGVRGRAGAAAELAPSPDHHRRRARPRLGGAGDAPGPEPGVLLDVARRAARAVGRQGASPVPDAVPLDDLRRHHRRGHHRHVPDPDPGRAGQHRHAARLRARLRGRAGSCGRRGPTWSGRSGRRWCRSSRSSGSWPASA